VEGRGFITAVPSLKLRSTLVRVNISLCVSGGVKSAVGHEDW
jgi:hypothetical protein